MIERLQAAGWIGWVVIVVGAALALVGIVDLACWYIQLVWFLVAVRTFGAPMLDFLSAFGVLLGLLPVISVAILSIRTADK